VFAIAIKGFGSIHSAILSVILFFVVGAWLLTKVDVEEGQRIARTAEMS
jgi:MFS-type transporter involved in bile tolerance (Atg22 family)